MPQPRNYRQQLGRQLDHALVQTFDEHATKRTAEIIETLALRGDGDVALEIVRAAFSARGNELARMREAQS